MSIILKNLKLVTSFSYVCNHYSAIGRFNDAALEPVVRKSHADLKNALERDGLSFEDDGTVKFAQYDAIYSMGSRRGECWIELNSDGCPW